MTDTKVSTVTLVLTRRDSIHPFGQLARMLKQNVALNHGRTVLTIEYPDGTKEHYSVYPGATVKSYDEYMAPLNWSKH